jgi:hypothetical protein
VPVRETFEAEMTRLEEGRDEREDKPAAEQGELFEPASKRN